MSETPTPVRGLWGGRDNLSHGAGLSSRRGYWSYGNRPARVRTGAGSKTFAGGIDIMLGVRAGWVIILGGILALSGLVNAATGKKQAAPTTKPTTVPSGGT